MPTPAVGPPVPPVPSAPARRPAPPPTTPPQRPLVATRGRRGAARGRARLGGLRPGGHRRRVSRGVRARAGVPRAHRLRARRGPVRRAGRRTAADLPVEQRRTSRDRRRARPRTGRLPVPADRAAGPARGADAGAGAAQGAAGRAAGRGGARGAVPGLPAADGRTGRARGLPHRLPRAGPHPGPDESELGRRPDGDARPAGRRPGAAGRLRGAGRPGSGGRIAGRRAGARSADRGRHGGRRQPPRGPLGDAAALQRRHPAGLQAAPALGAPALQLPGGVVRFAAGHAVPAGAAGAGPGRVRVGGVRGGAALLRRGGDPSLLPAPGRAAGPAPSSGRDRSAPGEPDRLRAASGPGGRGDPVPSAARPGALRRPRRPRPARFRLPGRAAAAVAGRGLGRARRLRDRRRPGRPSPIETADWADAGLDTMRLVRRSARFTESANRPRLEGFRPIRPPTPTPCARVSASAIPPSASTATNCWASGAC